MDYYCEIEFECPRCDDEISTTVGVNETYWEPSPGTKLAEIATITCPTCLTKFAAHVQIGLEETTMEFVDHSDKSIEAGPPIARMSDDWEQYEPPPDPYQIFNGSLHEGWVLLDEKGGDGGSFVNRMVFVHYIGALEAFLADTLINKVLVDGAALQKLIEKDGKLREQKFSLVEIGSAPDLVTETVRSRLRSEIWHNIPKASALYNITFGIDLMAMLGKDNPAIEKAIEYRHDCVHRNGYNKDGEQLDVFTKQYINAVGTVLDKLATGVLQAFGEQR